MMISEYQVWLSKTQQSAERGDPQAQMNLGLAYWQGQVVEKDVEKALTLLKEAEVKVGEEAWVKRLRVLFRENDPRIVEAFAERMPHRNGTACFIYGRYLVKSHNATAAIGIYKQGAETGHYGCSGQYHLLTHKGIWIILGLPKLVSILAKGSVATWRDANDVNCKN